MYDYGEQITRFVTELPHGQIFETEQVALSVVDACNISLQHAKSVTNNQLKRMADAGHIDRIQKGVYFKTKNTVFGKVRPNLDSYAMQVLTTQDKQVIGYVTGAAFMNRIGLTTLMPKEIEIVSNQYRRVLPQGCHVTAKRPVVEVTAENYKYLQMLDAIEKLNDNHIDAENPYELIRAAARNGEIAPMLLIGHARKHYPVKTLLRTVDIFTGVM